MTKKVYFLLLFLLSAFYSQAQELTVKSFSEAIGDLSASTIENRRTDKNGVLCGLVKVQLPLDGVTFDGAFIIGDVVRKADGYWVYMNKGAFLLHIMHPSFHPLELNLRELPPAASEGFRGVQSLCTYKLVVNVPVRTMDMQTNAPSVSVSSLKPVETFSIDDVAFRMVRVDEGRFQMGSAEKDDEMPIHPVRLSTFYIGETEVTQELWECIMGTNPSLFKGPKRPVEKVSWEDCQLFLKRLNEKTQLHFRLPTEAEWEYAAHGGNKSRGYPYSSGTRLKDVAWYYDNANKATHEVATKQPNELGIYDMTGNVWEWCYDWYDDYYYRHSPFMNPYNDAKGMYRVLRGESYLCYGKDCNITRRFRLAPSSRSSITGFRLALSDSIVEDTADQMVVPQDSLPSVGTENGHAWVDLGLSVRWATTNVGANEEYDYGDYFAWGETSPKEDYGWKNYKYCKRSNKRLTKYCTFSSYGLLDDDKKLEETDDAAHGNWGGKWRMPTNNELSELYLKCSWKRVGNNGHACYQVTGPNGNSIFFPLAGFRHGSNTISSGLHVYCWSSSLYSSCPDNAWYLNSSFGALYHSERSDGLCVRPVIEK